MSYEKQTWETGDIVTSAKLNHMEDGIADGGGGGSHMYNITEDPVTYLISCNATPESLEADFNGGIMPSFKYVSENPLLIIGYNFESYKVSGSSYELQIRSGSDNFTLKSDGSTNTFAEEGDGD